MACHRVLVVGGSYAGLAATVNLLDLSHGRPCRFSAGSPPTDGEESLIRANIHVTIVDERDGYYHLIGQPLSYATKSYADRAWQRFDQIPALQDDQVTCIQGSVLTVDCEKKIAHVQRSGHDELVEVLPYDYLVAASGSRRQWPSAPQAFTKQNYLAECDTHIQQIEAAKGHGVAVVGGGAVGVEMAAELKLVYPNIKVTLVQSGSRLLSAEPFSDEYRDLVASCLQKNNVELLFNSRVSQIIDTKTATSVSGKSIDQDSKDDPSSTSPRYRLGLSNGQHFHAGHVIMAVSHSHPTSTYLPAEALDEKGLIRIDSTLNFSNGDHDDNAAHMIPNAAYHYAAGDIVSWPGVKRAGAAMYHGHYAAWNIYQRIVSDTKKKPKRNVEQKGSRASSRSQGHSTEDRDEDTHAELASRELPFMHIERPLPMICIALGTTAASYHPDFGIAEGKDVMKSYFEEDLGWRICWDWMGLGKAMETTGS